MVVIFRFLEKLFVTLLIWGSLILKRINHFTLLIQVIIIAVFIVQLRACFLI